MTPDPEIGSNAGRLLFSYCAPVAHILHSASHSFRSQLKVHQQVQNMVIIVYLESGRDEVYRESKLGIPSTLGRQVVASWRKVLPQFSLLFSPVASPVAPGGSAENRRLGTL